MLLSFQWRLAFGLPLPATTVVVPPASSVAAASEKAVGAAAWTRFQVSKNRLDLPSTFRVPLNSLVDESFLQRHMHGEADRILGILIANGPQYPRRIVDLSEGTVGRDGIYMALKRMVAKKWLRKGELVSGLGKGPERQLYEVTEKGRDFQDRNRPLAQSSRIIVELLHRHGEHHGRHLAELSQGRLAMDSIYVLLSRLEKGGWITSRVGAGERGRPRYYRLTEAGRALAELLAAA